MPIYVALLPKKVQRIIGKTHPDTRKALNMLKNEGFRLTGEVDIFAGGPKITCKTNEVRSIAESKLAVVERVGQLGPKAAAYLVSNIRIDFRCALAPISFDKGVSISEETAQVLQVEPGDWIRYVSSK